MRLPESQRCIVPVLKVEICRGINIDFIRSCGRIRDFVSFLVKITIAVRKQHCSALLFFLAERRVLCPPVMPPFLSCQVVLYVVCFPCCSISNCRVLCTPGAKMLQRSDMMSVWPSTFRPQTLQDPDKLRYLWGVLFVLNLLFQNVGLRTFLTVKAGIPVPVKHLHDPTRTRGYGSGRVYPRVRVYPQTSKTHTQ